MLAMVLALGACATAPPAALPQNPELAAALSAEQQRDYVSAARRWTALATAEPLQASSAWLRAADNWWLAGDAQQSNSALARVINSDLGAEDSARLALLQGEKALQDRNITQADFFLSAADAALPPDQRQRRTQALQALERLRQDPDAALLADIDAMIERLQPVNTAGALEIVTALEALPAARLQAEANLPTRLGQWSALALDLRNTTLRRDPLLEAAGAWATLNPLHPVGEAAYLELAWQYGQQFSTPARIAVLLPTSGPLAGAGTAIRDGLITGWLENPQRSRLDFFPLDEQPASAVAAYREAERLGYDWVIGPLRRASVDAIAALPDAQLPALLLNWPTAPAADDVFEPAVATVPAAETTLFSLSLSQEAEAASVARKMLESGHQRTILLLTAGGWGERTEAAFMDSYLAGGGEVVALERFDRNDADHSAKLTGLLQIQDGRDRRRRLQSALNLPLEFEDSRRDDFGAFFMATDPVLARQLKPQLRFFDAGEKPVFAMSRVFSGEIDASADADLNGVVIPTTRWTLDEQGSELALASLRNGAFGSLHALGRDAWNLLPWLDTMRRDPSFVFPALTGDLYLGENGQLQREPVWGQFRRGTPAPFSGAP